MLRRGFAVLLCASLGCLFALPAAAEMNDRLSQQRFGAISSGEYLAGDRLHFSLSRYRGELLMRVNGEPEIYVLYADYGTLGGRVLRYDSGAVAIQVAGWGAMTIYTDNQPDGLPAMRTGDAATPNLPAVSQSLLLSTADDEAAHLAYVRDVHLTFAADWNAFAGDSAARALMYDTLENTARGVARFTATPVRRDAFAQRISIVRIQTATKPLIQISGHTLIVTFNPAQGFMGRASSRAIAFALGKMFRQPMPN
jgi:hypothetical protein